MNTVKGVVMSPRMERLWRYVREERGIDLCDWSTDECVERRQVPLREGEAVLAARAAASPEDRDLQDLLADYRTILNRRPHARASQAEIDASERRALAARREVDAAEETGVGRKW